MTRSILSILSFACVITLAYQSSTFAQCNHEWKQGQGSPILGGEVNATKSWDADGAGPSEPLLVVGGSGLPSEPGVYANVVLWDGESWQTLGPVSGGAVYALAEYNGELIAGGIIYYQGEGVDGLGVARWNGSNWNSLGGNFQGIVHEMTLFRGALVVAGYLFVDGVQCSVAQWDGQTWIALGDNFNGQINALIAHGGDLIAGGQFTSTGRTSANRIARWDGLAWQPFGNGMNDTVSSLAEFNGELVAGGYFTLADGVAVGRIAAWNGSAWHSLGLGVNGGGVLTLTYYEGDLIAGGYFSVGGGGPGSYIGKWNGISWQPLVGGMDNGVRTLVEHRGDLVAGGSFGTINGATIEKIAKWNGTAWRPFGNGTDNTVAALVVHDGSLIAGGEFWSAGGVASRSIARGDGQSWKSLVNGVYNSYSRQVYCLGVHHGELIAGGELLVDVSPFQVPHSIARWNGSSWTQLGLGFVGLVFAVAEFSDELIAGGRFGYINGASATLIVNNIARWNGSSWSQLAGGGVTGGKGEVRALCEFNNELIVAGDFTMAGVVSANNIARWNGASWQPLGNGVSGGVSYSTVRALTVYNGNLIAGGDFRTAGDVAANYIARWDGTTWHPLGTGMASTGFGGNASVVALTVYDGELYAGGQFALAGGAQVNFIARWNGAEWSSLDTGVGGVSGNAPPVKALAEFHGELIVGGAFAFSGNVYSGNWARWGPGGPNITRQPTNQIACLGDTVTFSVTAIGAGATSYQWRRHGNNLANGRRIAGVSTPTLALYGVIDSGPYDCVITDECGSTVSQAGRILLCNATIETK